ncbi:hypothetical protein HETIRDRAFT_311265 [Heterobasidion irregulare TC 32-1]|uniref:Uncharacterized protein n=1 Tax=Heterobasidion irregulare (strain TC 32-1) TaxID=747525 RepID=W4KIA0_HETIT|nr:uncharacterized protein HETIRDRAFT_311265 [Heterobasidion irregulare TC 32-1]ETW85588.1 hypothetical protein HETIRDRAFT_311265 [Heterobasidion irregulare TC 32-1]
MQSCGQTDPSAAKCPSVGYGRLGEGRLCSVQVGIFSTHLALFGVSPKLPKYLPWTLAWVHAHQRNLDNEDLTDYLDNEDEDLNEDDEDRDVATNHRPFSKHPIAHAIKVEHLPSAAPTRTSKPRSTTALDVLTCISQSFNPSVQTARGEDRAAWSFHMT